MSKKRTLLLVVFCFTLTVALYLASAVAAPGQIQNGEMAGYLLDST